MALVKYIYSDKKHRYGEYSCDICSALYVTRIRPRKLDNCGCRGTHYVHGHERNRTVSKELKATFYRRIKRGMPDLQALGIA